MRKRIGLGCAIVLAALFGCSGGGGGGESNRVPVVRYYDLDPEYQYEPGYSEGWDIAGTAYEIPESDDTCEITGSLLTQVLSRVVSEGETFTPVQTHITMTICDVGIPASIRITYYDEDLDPYGEWDSDGRLVRQPNVIRRLPHNAEIGAFGEGTSWVYTDGDRSTSSWSLEEGTGAYATLQVYRTIKDATGNTVSYVEVTSVINTEGEVLESSRKAWDYEIGLRIEAEYTAR